VKFNTKPFGRIRKDVCHLNISIDAWLVIHLFIYFSREWAIRKETDQMRKCTRLNKPKKI